MTGVARPPLPLGTYGSISRTAVERIRLPGAGKYRVVGLVTIDRRHYRPEDTERLTPVTPTAFVARARFRDFDGHTRKVEAWGTSGAAAERALILSLADRSAPSGESITGSSRLTELAVVWLAELERSSLASNSRRRYRELVEHHILPGVGGLMIREATVAPLDRFLRSVADNTGAATAKGTRTVLSQMLGLAARYDAIPQNPIRDTSPVSSQRKEIRALSEREVRALRAKLAADKKAVVAGLPDLADFMLGTGVRIGEALALRWADLDLGSAVATVTITGTVVRVQSQGLTIQDHPKSAAGRRRLMLPPFVVAMLLRRQVDQSVANTWDLVFPSAAGTLREPQNLHRQWRNARERAGFGWVTPHTFRKSVATAIALGDLRGAADQLGHSGTAVTERHYVQRTGAGPDARALLDEAFGRRQDE